jgi:phosphoglycerate dehydrogenase-like enzyme
VVGADGWRDLLPQADFVVIAAPLTEATRGMIGAAEFARFQPGAYLINIARGAILDQAALISALKAGQLAGAALDVTEPEPPPDDDPIWDTPNVWVTPHISGSSPRTRERQFDIFFDNLLRYRARQPLRNLVDKEAGY